MKNKLIEQYTPAIRASFTQATSWTPEAWTPQNPSRGHCGNVCCLYDSTLYYPMGGVKIVKAVVHTPGSAAEIIHYYCPYLPDLTIDQFPKGSTISKMRDITRAELLANEWFKDRWYKFMEDFNNNLRAAV